MTVAELLYVCMFSCVLDKETLEAWSEACFLVMVSASMPDRLY